MKRKPLEIGARFGRLEVVAEVEPEVTPHRRRFRYECKCDCGATKVATQGDLCSGDTTSCGCFLREQIAKSNREKKKGVTFNVRHGDNSKRNPTPEYRCWKNMRCRAAGTAAPQNYADRGIRCCAGWDVYENFLADMGRKPTGARYSIDRINNDGHYSCGHCDECVANGWPANCRWATDIQQANNRRPRRDRRAA